MEDKHELKHRYRNYFGVFNRYSVPGFVLLLHGIAIFGLGCFDIGWTVSRYDPSSCVPSPGFTCGGNHVYTLVGSSLWGGALITIDSVLALWIPHCYIANSCMFQFYTALTFVNLITITPAVVVLNVLELALNNNVFYVYTPQTGFFVGDVAKFGVVFAIIILSTLAFLATGLNLLITLVCPAPKKLRGDYKRPFADWHLPHFTHRKMNPQSRPVMYNPNMTSAMYGGGAGYVQPPIMATQVAPVGAAMYDPYRYYNALAGNGYGYGGVGY